MNDWLKTGFANMWLPYTQMQNCKLPLAVKKTKGSYIYLEDGRKLIDGISSWWSVSHGYNHPYIQKKMAAQLKKMPHIMLAGLANKPAYNLATKLVNFVNSNKPSAKDRLEKVFFSDSGSTAVEVALKIAVQYFLNQGIKRSKIIAFANSYHGDTMAGMSLTDPKNGMHKKFKDYLPQELICKFPKNSADLLIFEKFLKANCAKAAALIMEPLIQCAGGMIFHEADILAKIAKLCRKYNILLIFDECAVGFYRTGKRFAYHHSNITPDILVLGKALTGGFVTLSATITNNEIYNKFLDDTLDKALMHGPTFMGNALACSAANASLDLFSKYDYAKYALNLENLFKKYLVPLEQRPKIKEVRILGAVAVIELKNISWAEILKLREDFVNLGVWLRPFAKVIYLMPPLNIAKQDAEKLCKAIIKLV
jgi:adenosylmethionine-8-amino-7-oxononanoate aminotransferase